MNTIESKKRECSKVTCQCADGDPLFKRGVRVRVKRKRSLKERIAEDAVTYRTPMEITRILQYPSGDTYPICPRCEIPVEREYMLFCDRCGQKLNWSKLKNAIVVFPGYKHRAK